MALPGDNRGKVGNIVRKQNPQFRELYYRLIKGLPGTYSAVCVTGILVCLSLLAEHPKGSKHELDEYFDSLTQVQVKVRFYYHSFFDIQTRFRTRRALP